MKIYISGKITGLPKKEYTRKFHEAGAELTTAFNVAIVQIINPLDIDPKTPNPTWIDFMAEDIRELLQCDGIYMLDNWQDSKGARIEHAIAKEMGITIKYQNHD